MTEPVMYFGIGFFVAALLGLLIVLHVHNRAARLGKSPGSSIEPMQAYAALVVGHGRRTQTLDINSASGEASAPTINRGALADRIRALRTTASRAAAN
jgi:hypothetical protein